MPDWPAQVLPSPEAALRDINHEDPRVRAQAAVALASAPEALIDEAKAALVLKLDDQNPRVRAQVTLALAELGAEDAVGQIEALVDDEDVRVRQAAVIALGESGHFEAISVVARCLEAESADVRFQAVLATARLDPEHAVERLAPLVGDPDPEVRANVAAAFADVGAQEVIPHLWCLLDDENNDVRYEAAFALATLGDHRSAPVLIEALGDADVAPQGVRALAVLGHESGVAPLERLARRWLTPAALRAAAAGALTALDESRGWPLLEPWLRARRREPRAMAIYVCGEYEIRPAVSTLIQILDDQRSPDRDAAARSLGLIGDDSACDALERVSASTGDPDLSADALEALARLASSS